MALYLAPIVNDQQSDSNGAPLSGGFVYTYLAGSSSPYPTYTDNTGVTPQSNPVILNTLGLPPSPIWLQGGTAYKFIIRDSLGVLQRTIDNVSGINDAGNNASQWVIFGSTPTYISPTTFSVAGDQTGVFQVGRRTQVSVTAGTLYGTIVSAAFSTLTTVTLSLDIGVLDAGLSTVSLGLLTPVNPSFTPIPKNSVMAFFQAAAPIGWTQITTYNDSALRIVSGVGGGVGGSVAFSAAFKSQAVAGSNSATTLATSQIPDHQHLTPIYSWNGHAGSAGSDTPLYTGTPAAQTFGVSGTTGGSHNHTFTGTAINLAVNYIDMILASKN